MEQIEIYFQEWSAKCKELRFGIVGPKIDEALALMAKRASDLERAEQQVEILQRTISEIGHVIQNARENPEPRNN